MRFLSRTLFPASGVALLASLLLACGDGDPAPTASPLSADTTASGGANGTSGSGGAFVTPGTKPEEPGKAYGVVPGVIAKAGSAPYLAHSVVVKRAPAATQAAFDAALADLGAHTVGDDTLLARELGFQRLWLPGSVDADTAMARLRAAGVVSSAEPDFVVPLAATFTPNDPNFGSQWAHSKARSSLAWSKSTGTRDVLVVILDTGIDLDHPDLAGNLWTNPREILGNGVDDDGNGVKDDTVGWDFVNSDSNPDDDGGHGTHVAGIVGAMGNNGLQVAGVNHRVTLAAVKVCGTQYCYSSAIVNGYLYAAAVGARVANASLGGVYTPPSYETDAIRRLDQAGVVLVVAAGNSTINNDGANTYPANFSATFTNVISVAATTSSDTLASFSNYGRTKVQVAAPGDGILSTARGGGTVTMSGTSMASPFVAGAAALRIAVTPAISAAEVRNELIRTSQPLTSLTNRVVANGRVDLAKLVGADDSGSGGSGGTGGVSGSGGTGGVSGTGGTGGVSGTGGTTGSGASAGTGGTGGAGDACKNNPCSQNGECQLSTAAAGGYKCSCKKGYDGDGKTCNDVDECVRGLHECGRGAKCVNSPGAYRCDCNNGWKSDGTGRTCKDVDECADGTKVCGANADCRNEPGSALCLCRDGFVGDGTNCQNVDECANGTHTCAGGTICVDTIGSFRCECPGGTTAVGGTCADIDECAVGLHACDPNATCENRQGSYLCRCNEGYSGDGFFCDDVDECASKPCAVGATCKNLVGGFECTCGAGLVGDGLTCTDRDECADGSARCDGNATCVNKEGGYDCRCNTGYTAVAGRCDDVDECALGTHQCGGGTVCANTVGGYRCDCPSGTEPFAGGCRDVDECTNGMANCGVGTCVNLAGGFRCDCPPGFSGDSCADVDECQSAPCAANATCTNLPGSYTCQCAAGFAGNGTTSCTDVDECATAGTCGPSQRCVNQPGSYKCECGVGYAAVGKNCVDVDECASNNGGCGAGSTCTNVPGSRRCQCQPGYEGPGTSCVDVDECLRGTAGCAAGAVCSNTPGSFLCVCPPGYTGNGKTCTDVDECATNNGGCAPNARCTNLPGSVACTCPSGTTGDGKTCTDIDECVGSPCSASGVCANNVGSYSCSCAPGYSGNGKTCTDINECATGAAGCSPNGVCRNLPGSFECACKSGYTGDGKTCVDIDECAAGTAGCSANATCVNLPGSVTCRCNAGYAGDGRTCSPSPVDECANGTAQCPPEAQCRDLASGFTCECPTGTSYSGSVCADIDECAAGTDDCDADAECTNLPGSFSCSCPPGLVGDGRYCAPIDECSSGAHNCSPNAACTDTPDGFTCACKAGYVGDGRVCQDVDECATGSHDCAATGVCTNTPGSFTCRCATGYTGDGRRCARNECTQGLHDCAPGAICVDTEAGFECRCPAGYAGDGKTCTDIDECQTTRPCDANANCTNTPGSYQCQCRVGWTGPGSFCVANPTKVVSVSALGDFTCARLDNGALRCFGRNTYGQLGQGHTRDLGDDELAGSVPYVDVGEWVTQVSAGVSHACAVLDGGAVRCWGRNEYGQLGIGSKESIGDNEPPRFAPIVALGEPATAVAAGGEHSCALLVSGNVRCWGLGIDGQLGTGNTRAIGDDELVSAGTTVALGERATAITAGRDHSCALLASGAVRCWGRGRWAATGLGTTSNVGDDEPVNAAPAVSLGATATAVTAGWYHSCALLSDGTARCWGYGGAGQLGLGNTNDVGDDELPSSQPALSFGVRATAVSAGLHHSCVLLTGGGVRCWGLGDDGRLGLANTRSIGDDEEPTSVPPIELGDGANMLASGTAHSCAVLAKGALRCWGSGEFGRLGTGTTVNLGDDENPSGSVPVLINAVDECAIGVAECGTHANCVDEETGFRCECAPGFSGNGLNCTDIDECALGTAGCSANAACTNSVGSFSCACNAGFTGDGKRCDDVDECALGACDPNANCANTQGSYSCSCRPSFTGDGHVCVPVLVTVASLAAGGDHTCALLSDGTVRCFGQNAFGELGLGNTQTIGDDETPVSAPLVALGEPATALALGLRHSCALLASGAVRCWGDGALGQLGHGATTRIGDDELPTSIAPVSLGEPAIAIAAGDTHSCAVLASGAVRCWGAGGAGRLGTGAVANVGDDELPTAVAPIQLGSAAIGIAAGRFHSCALLTGGAVRCFGLNAQGQLGLGHVRTIGDDEAPSTEAVVSLGGAATALALGADHSCALLANGAVRCWGSGANGRLGTGNVGTVGDDEAPSAVSAVSLGGLAVGLSVGETFTCARLESGAVRCFGWNGAGQLGLAHTRSVGDDELPSSEPPVSLGAAATALASGKQHSCALLIGGAVRCWGNGSTGALGRSNLSTLGDDEAPNSVAPVSLLP